MPELDLVVRVAAGSVLLMLAGLLLGARRSAIVPWLFLLMALGLCGFLARNTGYPGLLLSGFPAIVAAVLSGCAALFIWWFCLAVFDDDFRMGPLSWGLGGIWFLVAMTDRGVLFPAYADAGLTWLLVLMGVGMVGHLAWHLLRDNEGDLVESRRRARWRLVAGLALLLIVDLGVDLAMGFAWKPPWFTLLQNGAILSIALLMAHWLLRADVDALTFGSAATATRRGYARTRSSPPSVVPTPARLREPAVAAPLPAARSTPVAAPSAQTAGESSPRISPTDQPDGRLLRRLDQLMDVEHVYRDPALTFSAFAARMGAPEPEVRRLVNQGLGYRHFRNFLNTWRVADARAALADPARANDKMVAIAFEAGFASLASFNRAFKEIEGRPPGELRIDRSDGARTPP